ncbi:MAG: DUF6686 family protein [Bacteroidota bacterium]
MCNRLEVIRQTEKGYLMHCRGCGRFQLGFGTTAISMGKKHLRALWKELEFQLLHWKNRLPKGEKSFFFATDSQNVKLVLCYMEMEWLYDLISESFLILDAQALIKSESSE